MTPTRTRSRVSALWSAALLGALAIATIACVPPPQQQATVPAEEATYSEPDGEGTETGDEGTYDEGTYDEGTYDTGGGGGGAGGGGSSSCGQIECSTNDDCAGCGPCSEWNKRCLLF